MKETTTRYIFGKLDNSGSDFSYWNNDEQLNAFMSEMDMREDELPPGLREALADGEALWYGDGNEDGLVLPVPKAPDKRNETLRQFLRTNGLWTRTDDGALRLLALTTSRLNRASRTTILEVDDGSESALIEAGLWRGDEKRLRVTRLGENHERKFAMTIWYQDGTVVEWEDDSCRGDLKKEQQQVLIAIAQNL